MTLVDWAARWNPVPDDRPARVWLPAQLTPAPAAGGQGAAGLAMTPEPRSTTLTLTAHQAEHLPLWLPHLLAQHDVRPGDRVTVYLGDLHSVHLTGLELLMTVLWRRVGTDGEVLLAGGTPGLRAQLASLEVTPASCRAAAYGPPPAPATAPAPVPAPVDPGLGAPSPVPAIPQQRQAQEPLHEPGAGHAWLALSGDVNVTVDLRTQARLHDLVEQARTRTLTIELSDVTYLSLSTLRLLLDADRRLRARGGRLRLLHPNPPVQRLLAVTRTTYLAEEQPPTTSSAPSAASAAPPQRLGPVPAATAARPVVGSGHGRRRRAHSRPSTAAAAGPDDAARAS